MWVVGHLVGGQRVLRRKRPVGDARQPVSLAGEVDFVLDVRVFFGELAGLDLELLDEAREHDGQEEGGAQPHHEGCRQRGETRAGGIDEQAGCDQHHQHRHDPVGRDSGGDVGGADPVDEAALAQQQFVEVQLVMDGPECGKDRGQDREVADRARRQLQALETGSRKVDAGDHQHHEDDHAQQPTPQQTVEGEGEDVERNVPMPDRILHVEGLLVEERQDRLPLSGPDLAEEEAKKEDHEQGEDGGGRRQWALPDADR